jgi:uncharacterized protein (DUF58 family)
MNTRTVSLQLRKKILPWLVGLVFILYIIDSYQGWLTLFITLGGVWAIAYLWVKNLAAGLELTREMRFGWAQVGDRLEERFTLTNHGWIPALAVEVDYASDMPDYKPSRGTSIGSGGTIRWDHSGICTRRGVFTLGPICLRGSDPFGIYSFTVRLSSQTTILVSPPVIPQPDIRISPGGRAGEGRLRQNALEQTLTSSRVHPYQPGDSLRMIHWPTTARKGTLYSRVFDHMPASDWWIFVDLESRAQAGEGFETTDEHGIILAASLAEAGLKTGKAVGLGLYGEEMAWLPPAHGEEQRQQILQHLAKARRGQVAFPFLLAQTRVIFRQVPSLILITPNLQPEWINALAPLIQLGVVPTVLLLEVSAYRQDGSGQREQKQLLAALAEMGVASYLIPRAYFDRPESRPGIHGHWIWRNTRSSRAVLAQQPGDLDWKRID